MLMLYRAFRATKAKRGSLEGPLEYITAISRNA